MTYGQMMADFIKKFGAESSEVLKLKLMWLSFASPNGTVTFRDIEYYYQEMVDKYNSYMI